MQITIKGRNAELFAENVKRVMNLAMVAFGKGHLPTDREREEPERLGNYWYQNLAEEKFELLPVSNNYKAFIREKGENFVVVEFFSRYDKGTKADAVANLVLAMFEEDEVELVK